MIRLWQEGAYVFNSKKAVRASEAEGNPALYRDGEGRPLTADSRRFAAERTLARQILRKHNQAGEAGTSLRLRFDCLTSHDITYVNIVQSLRASAPGLSSFPVPYVLSNCHNSLCAVGGTINADDHAFGLSAAHKYGGIFVPPHLAVIHQYMREMMTGCGKMILGSDSHTRYGALGTMGIGEGGGELVKQLLNRTYDVPMPEVVGVCLSGEPRPGIGPQDVALALIGAAFKNGYVKNKVLEFFGEGTAKLSIDFRCGVDVMTTETACLSSIWATDDTVREYYHAHGREKDYQEIKPGEAAYYDGLVEIDLSAVKPMIALPFHPSNVYEIEAVVQNPSGIAEELEDTGFDLRPYIADGKIKMGQGIIAGCAGGLYENICAAASILDGSGINGESLNIYPASQPVYLSLIENGVAARLTRAGAVMKTAFCGPCFGAGDIPANNALSGRHTTRNFPNREGSKPGAGQRAYVALMDARSIAATAKNGGMLTAAREADTSAAPGQFFFDKAPYTQRVYNGYGQPKEDVELIRGPGIVDWPVFTALAENILLTVAAFIDDPVTTTDELIPSGETSSYRSNPLALAEFTLSRKDPGYVKRAKAAVKEEVWTAINEKNAVKIEPAHTALGSVIYAVKPGDGSAREQAASCQRVLGGLANIAVEYATKRYRSNLVNWGVLPFVMKESPAFQIGDLIYIPGIRTAVEHREERVIAYLLRAGEPAAFTLYLPNLADGEAEIILQGGLINYYKR